MTRPIDTETYRATPASSTRRQILGGGAALAGLTLLPARSTRSQSPRFGNDPFSLGVASGYPEPGAVVLWTRLAPEPGAPGGGVPPEPVAVAWELALDEGFRRLAAQGIEYATPDWAHSVHLEVAGLEPARPYWYRFRCGDAESAVGQTRTAPAPAAEPEAMRVALACCQHYESGHYAAYGAMARDGLDLIVHVGDYIYENRGVSRVRAHSLPEAYTLDDYRLRYATYKSDPQLQAAHAACPWLVTWDDHEVDNDYADWHSLENDVQALFLARRAAAYRAYYEHMPLPRRHVPYGPYQRLHARRRFGGLADFLLLDGRQYRSDQACGAGRASPCAALYDRERTMLGREQEDWVRSSLQAAGSRWTLIGQQTVFAQMDQEPGPDIGIWTDGWSGYPAARSRLIETLQATETRNPVVLSGDIHAFLVNDVHTEPGRPDTPVAAAEFVTGAISSPGANPATPGSRSRLIG
jgi:alkaline phosphatase D